MIAVIVVIDDRGKSCDCMHPIHQWLVNARFGNVCVSKSAAILGEIIPQKLEKLVIIPRRRLT